VSAPATALTGIAAGAAAGLAVLLRPRRPDATDPARRLAGLRSAEEAVRRRLRFTLPAPFSVARRRKRRDEESHRLAPLAADLLAACLSAGAAPARASEAVATALMPPHRLATAADEAAFELAGRFQEVAALLRLGGNPVTSWRPLTAEPGLAPIAEAAARAGLTGAPPAQIVRWTAADLRATRHARGTALARQAGARAMAPLAGCFLPAFVLIGIVPIVIGLAERLLP
jgi:hypothetical protein